MSKDDSGEASTTWAHGLPEPRATARLAVDDAAALRVSGFHFQLYAPGMGHAVKWRLLSGNNRDMGRGVAVYADAPLCLLGIAEMLRNIGQFEPLFVPDGSNSWRWYLRLDGEPVVCSGHAYDRKVRCREGHTQFLRFAPEAHVRNDVVASSARRWSSASIDVRDRVTPAVIDLPAGNAIPFSRPTR